MRNYNILFFFGVLFLYACGDNIKIPNDVIPKKQMVGLITQVHLIDGTMYNYPQNADTLYKKGMGRYLQLFKTYHTDTAQFKRSMVFYTTHSVMFNDMYDQVMVNLNARLDSLNNVRKQLAKADSIKNLVKFRKKQDSIKKAEADKAKGLKNQ